MVPSLYRDGGINYVLDNNENFSIYYPEVGPPSQTVSKHEIHLDYKVTSPHPYQVSVTNSYNSSLTISTDFNNSTYNFSGSPECSYIIDGSHMFLTGSNTTGVTLGTGITLKSSVGVTVFANLGSYPADSKSHSMTIQ